MIERGFEPVSPYKKDEAMLRSYKTLVYLTQKNQLYRATSLERERERERTNLEIDLPLDPISKGGS